MIDLVIAAFIGFMFGALFAVFIMALIWAGGNDGDCG